MTNEEYKAGRFFLVRLTHKSDVIKEITEFAVKNNIKMATFTLVGALQKAKIAYYDQRKKEYRVVEIQGAHEIASGIGNVSIYKNSPFVHAHVVLADEHANTKAGHLLEGSVFAAELHLQELDGPKLERAEDKATGLALWKK